MSHQSQFRLRTVCQAGRSTVQLGGPVDGLRRDVSGGRGGGGHVAIGELRLDAAQHLCHPGEGLEGGASLYRGASEEGSEEGSETAVELHTHTHKHTRLVHNLLHHVRPTTKRCLAHINQTQLLEIDDSRQRYRNPHQITKICIGRLQKMHSSCLGGLHG